MEQALGDGTDACLRDLIVHERLAAQAGNTRGRIKDRVPSGEVAVALRLARQGSRGVVGSAGQGSVVGNRKIQNPAEIEQLGDDQRSADIQAVLIVGV